MSTPHVDDFLIERNGDRLVVTFTPDCRTYTFSVRGEQLSKPTVSPSQVNAADYADDRVSQRAIELARLALIRSI
jgi:hypothetical protein